jgi:hypothetical protein
MRELDADLSGIRPSLLTPEAMEAALIVVTLGTEGEFSIPPELLQEHWSLEEIWEKPIEAVRRTRNEIERLVRRFAARKGWMKSTGRRTREWSPTGLPQ